MPNGEKQNFGTIRRKHMRQIFHLGIEKGVMQGTKGTTLKNL